MKRTSLTLGLACAFFCNGGELINRNSRMELGVPGKGAPAYRLEINRAAVETVWKTPDKLYYARSAPGGNPGLCLEIPGYAGVSNYQLELADFLLTRDGEVEIAFDAKVAPDENGVLQPLRSFYVDFRTFADFDRDRYYPMLTGFSVKPTTEWQRFSKRFPVKAYTNYYNIWILPQGIPQGGTGNALRLDNFRFAYVDGPGGADPEEYAATPDRDDQIYAPGDRVEWTCRARLAGDAPAVTGKLRISREHNGTVLTELPVTLRRDADGVYEGKAAWTAAEYGSFGTELLLEGRTLRGVDSTVAVLHPVTQHPWGSPGWGLGANDDSVCPFGRSGRECVENYLIHCGSFERRYRLLRESGCQMLRFWGHWRMIEPEEGKFTSRIAGLPMEMMKKYQFETLFCLVGNFIIHDGRQGVEKRLKRGNSQVPEYLFQWYHQSGDPKKGSVLPPLEVYSRYLDFVLKSWGDQVKIWEVSNEPGIFGMPAKNYIDYLKYTYTTVKAREPESVILGNGVTGDFGINVVKWCEQLNEADPNYVNYLDAIAFHPYNSGLDYLNGVYNLYGQCTANIQSQLAKPRPLWNTECYYLQPAYRKQIRHDREFSRFEANDLLRHYLDGLYHGVPVSAAPAPSSYFHRTGGQVNLPSLNQNAAAQNALSALLTGMEAKCTPVDLGSKVRAGYFTDKAGEKALGFLYDLRPSGSRWIPGKADAALLDLYGNPLKSEERKLDFNPCFITGSPEAVVKRLKDSRFAVENPVELHGRRFGETLYLEGVNTTGVPGEFMVETAGETIQFSFRNHPESAVAAIPVPKEIPAGIRMAPETGSHTLPAAITLSKGSQAQLTSDGKSLKISLDVADAKPVPARDRALWEGSSVELFLDSAPFRRMAVNEVKPYQYIFAALPSATLVEIIATRNPDSKASRKVTLRDGGYRMELEVPLAELPYAAIYGFDLEINRPGQPKESLGSRPGQSFKERLHYHLLRIPEREFLRNGDFAQAEFGDPAWWVYPVRHDASIQVEDGKATLVNRNSGNKEVALSQRIAVTPGEYSKGTLTCRLSYRDLKAAAPGRGRHGLLLELNHGKGWQNYAADTRKSDIEGSAESQVIQFDFRVPPAADWLNFRIGLGNRTTGTVVVESIQLTME